MVVLAGVESWPAPVEVVGCPKLFLAGVDNIGAMSTVNLEIPEDMEDDLDALVEQHPVYKDREALLLAFTQYIIAGKKATENIKHITDLIACGKEGEAARVSDEVLEANHAARDALLDFYGVPRKISQETKTTIEKSRREFEDGDFVDLEEV